MSLLETFREAYRNLDLLPLLDPQELGKFWVEYGTDVLAELQQLVEDDDSRDGKIIFAGHRGCGKSTLLAEFGRQCEERGYFAVVFSIANTIEMSDVNHINILFAIAVNLMYEAEKQQVSIPKATKDALHKWFATRIRIETESVNAEAGFGFDLFKLISSKLKTEATIRNEIKQEFERNISDLVGRLNEIAALIEAATHKEVLVIIDDLDKLDLGIVRQIYQDHIKALFQPSFRVIFTIPVSSLREGSLRATIVSAADDQIVEMPVVKLFKKGERRKLNPVPYAEAHQTLCDVLHKRISENIIEPQIADQIVMYSGGVLRELIRIANICCRICLRSIRRYPDRTDIIINQEVLQEAIKDIRLDFETPLGKADYHILKVTYESFQPDDPKEQTFLDLLHGLHILEYRNDEVWYDTHPIVTDLLQRKGLVS